MSYSGIAKTRKVDEANFGSQGDSAIIPEQNNMYKVWKSPAIDVMALDTFQYPNFFSNFPNAFDRFLVTNIYVALTLQNLTIYSQAVFNLGVGQDEFEAPIYDNLVSMASLGSGATLDIDAIKNLNGQNSGIPTIAEGQSLNVEILSQAIGDEGAYQELVFIIEGYFVTSGIS